MNKKLYSLNEILSKCGEWHKRGENEWETACPVCGSDHHLYMREENGKVLAYCQKCGATLPKVLEALDMNNGESPVAAKAPAPADKGKAPKEENHGPVIEEYPHIYRDPDGKEAYRKNRVKFKDGSKKFRFEYQDKSGNTKPKKPDGCNNLYNLDRLAAATPDTPLYIVEGEKCADSMTAAGFLATTTNTGAKNKINKYLTNTDREYLDKFPVKIVIPDNDDPGRGYAQAWQQERGARILHLRDIWPECPPKGDVADYFQANGDPDKIRNYQFPAQEEAAAPDLGTCQEEQIVEYFNTLDKAQMTSPELFARICAIEDPVKRQRVESLALFRAGDLSIKREFDKNYKAFMYEQAKKGNGNQEEHYTQFPEQPLQLRCGEWICDEQGVRKFVLSGNGKPKPDTASCIPLLPSAIYENQETGTEKIKLSFFKNGKWKQILVPRSIVANKTKIIALADDGIEVTSENSSSLVKYISDVVNSNQDTLPRVASVGHMGWVTGDEFVPYSDSIQPDFGDQFGALLTAIEPKGTLQEWYKIVVPLLKSPYMRMTIAASLASALIGPMRGLPFIFHLWGGTGAGKTVALKVAASIWGNPDEGKMVDTMNNTINYIMEKAGVLYSIPFFGDELQTIKGNGGNYDSLIYRVTGQANRGRLRANGSMGRRLSWQNSFLFTGEEPITQSNSGGGAINRVVELECTEKIIQDGNRTVTEIADCYGVLGPAFIAQARKSHDTNRTVFRQYEKDLLGMEGTGKQAQALALMLTAYSLFQSMAPSDCPMLTIKDAKGCMKSSQEVDTARRAYKYVCGQIAINQNKFVMDGIKPKGETWGGIVDSNTVNIFKEALEQILKEGGYSLQAVKREWLKRDYMVRYRKDGIFGRGSIGGITNNHIGTLVLDRE